MTDVTATSTDDRPTAGRRKDPQRSRITNGSALVPGVDGRSPWIRRCKDLIREHLNDLGGPDACSAAEVSIVRRAATLTVELERLETQFALAGAASIEGLNAYQRAASSLRRLLQAIGLDRRAKDISGLAILDEYEAPDEPEAASPP